MDIQMRPFFLYPFMREMGLPSISFSLAFFSSPPHGKNERRGGTHVSFGHGRGCHFSFFLRKIPFSFASTLLARVYMRYIFFCPRLNKLYACPCIITPYLAGKHRPHFCHIICHPPTCHEGQPAHSI